MEELRSTDILDREIAADARKKAERLLQRADADGKALLDAVPLRADEAKKQMEAEASTRAASFKRNLDASIPLEKERFKVSFMQKSITQAMEVFVKSCSKEELLSFVVARYNKAKGELCNKEDTAFCMTVAGLDKEEARKAFEKAGAKIKECKGVDASNILDTGVVLQGENVKATFTLEKIVSEIEDNSRAELAAALFGGAV